jgi:hypothetical protein
MRRSFDTKRLGRAIFFGNTLSETVAGADVISRTALPSTSPARVDAVQIELDDMTIAAEGNRDATRILWVIIPVG